MRVAALCDVHGNLPALDAVLAELEEQGVNAIVCGGDLASGPFAVEAFDRLTSRPDVLFVRGNADRFLLEGEREHGVDWSSERQAFGDERLAALAAWPLTVALEIEGLGRTLFCHAIPTADDPIFTRITPDAEVERMLGDTGADVVVCGHTHVQFDRRLPNGLRVVNAGSVGMPYEGRPGAFWALLGPDVELRSTEYDVEAAAEAIRGTVSPTAWEHAGWLLEPPDPDDVTAFFEAQRGA